MLKNKRKNKNSQRSRIYKLFLYTCFCVFIAGIGALFYILQANKPLYISPLPKSVVLSAVSEEERDIRIIKNKLTELNIDYESITKSQDNYLIRLKNKSEIVIGANKEVSLQLSSLQFILTRLTMEGRAFNQLDLRFDKPVIRFK